MLNQMQSGADWFARIDNLDIAPFDRMFYDLRPIPRGIQCWVTLNEYGIPMLCCDDKDFEQARVGFEELFSGERRDYWAQILDSVPLDTKFHGVLVGVKNPRNNPNDPIQFSSGWYFCLYGIEYGPYADRGVRVGTNYSEMKMVVSAPAQGRNIGNGKLFTEQRIVLLGDQPESLNVKLQEPVEGQLAARDAVWERIVAVEPTTYHYFGMVQPSDYLLLLPRMTAGLDLKTFQFWSAALQVPR